MNDLNRLLDQERVFHDRHAPSYLSHIENSRNRVMIRLRSKLFLKRLDPGVATVELGAGVGTWSRHFEKHLPLVSLDFSLDSLKILTRRAPDASPVQGDVRYLPFLDGACQQVFVGMVLHHLPYECRQQALVEIIRVLAPGGKVIIHEPNRSIKKSLFLFVKNLKRMAVFRWLFRLLKGEYENAGSSPVDLQMGRDDENVMRCGIEPQGFYPDELKCFLEQRGVDVSEIGYLHSLQLPTPKWFGLLLNRIVVGIIHLLERLFFCKAQNVSHFMYLVAQKKTEKQ